MEAYFFDNILVRDFSTTFPLLIVSHIFQLEKENHESIYFHWVFLKINILLFIQHLLCQATIGPLWKFGSSISSVIESAQKENKWHLFKKTFFSFSMVCEWRRSIHWDFLIQLVYAIDNDEDERNLIETIKSTNPIISIWRTSFSCRISRSSFLYWTEVSSDYKWRKKEKKHVWLINTIITKTHRDWHAVQI